MTSDMTDQNLSWPNGQVFNNVFLDYLPMAENKEGQLKEVGRIYFATDEPLASTSQSGPQVLKQIAKTPGKFLTDDDKEVLENLLKPIDGGHDGDRTRDPLAEIPGGEGLESVGSGHAFAKAMVQVTYVIWSFVGRADPREPSRHNIKLAKARVFAVGCYLAKYVWEGFKDSRRPGDYKTIASKIFQAYGPQQYTPDEFWKDYVEPLGSDYMWRANLTMSILSALLQNSLFAGEPGRDPSDVDQSEYPELRRVEIKVNSTRASADHDWTTDCEATEKKTKYYNADKDDRLPAVLAPDKLFDFNPDSQGSGDNNIRQKFKSEVNGYAKKHSNGELKDWVFADHLGETLYGYRWLRMAQHELFRGYLPSKNAWGPGQSNPGTEKIARSILCDNGLGNLQDLHGRMISNDLGNFLFGGNPFDNSEGLKVARQIAHQYYVRVNPFYRVAYMKEIPGTKRSDSWDYDGKANPPEEVELWPPQEDIKNVWTAVRGELNPKKYGDKSKVTPENDPFWGNDIPKVLGENADGGPNGYLGGAGHYKYMARAGHYEYDSFAYMDSGLDIVKQGQRKQLAEEYEKRNHTQSGRSRAYLWTLRRAIKEAQEMMKAELTADQYDVYLTKRRNPYPDYTNNDEWKRWGSANKDPYL